MIAWATRLYIPVPHTAAELHVPVDFFQELTNCGRHLDRLACALASA